MSAVNFFENIAITIASLDKDEVVKQIKGFKGRFKLDFSDAYLQELSLDRLRHILMAAIITNAKRAG